MSENNGNARRLWGLPLSKKGGTVKFLENKPTAFSKRQVHRIGSALRTGQEIDEELYRRILIHQSALCDHLESLAASTLSELRVPLERSTDSVVEPDSKRFFIGSRVKTWPVLVEKLRRMPSFPLESIQDCSGVRMDFDVLSSPFAEPPWKRWRCVKPGYCDRGLLGCWIG